MTDNQNKKHNLLTLWILIAIVLALGLALLFPHVAESLEIGGEIFLRLLKMIVVPLVVTSVLSGILGLGDVRKLGKPGAAAITYYLSTTILAVMVGLVVVNIVQPGVGAVDQATLKEYSGVGLDSPKEKLAKSLSKMSGLSRDQVAEVFDELPSGKQETPGIGTIFHNLFLMMFTDNLIQAALEINLLPLIVFSIVFGAMLTTLGQRVRTVTELIEQTNTALMSFVLLLMKLAPVGIFCLVTSRFGKAVGDGKFLQELSQIGWYFLTVLIGLAIHAFITLPAIFWIIRRQNPYKFMLQMAQALLTAFSTASSSATLPITMECAEENAGISKRSTEFVIPLGATINMDGTALYEAAAAIFIAQVIGFDLSLTQQVIIAVTATLAAIGAAGIPEAGLVTLLIVLNAVGLPIEYVGLILSVDWLLDRFRTAVNAFGDSVGAAVVEKTIPADMATAEVSSATA